MRYKHFGEGFSQFTKRVGILKSTLSVAFRVIEQMERKYSYCFQKMKKKKENSGSVIEDAIQVIEYARKSIVFLVKER